MAARALCLNEAQYRLLLLFVFEPFSGKLCAGRGVKKELPGTARAEPGPGSHAHSKLIPKPLPF